MTTVPWPFPRLIAHRGGGKAAPENTLAALAVGRRAGFLGVEVDAMLSRDRTPYLLHDPELERTTNGRGSLAGTGDGNWPSWMRGPGFPPILPGNPCPPWWPPWTAAGPWVSGSTWKSSPLRAGR